jgi:hypothetical protein
LSNRVVDTNVAVVANGGPNVTASAACQINAIRALQSVVNQGRVSIDQGDEIVREYSKRLDPRGQPGVGDWFFRHVIDNQGNPSKVRAHDISHARGDALRAAFINGNLALFDSDDRIFALCSVVARVPVQTATDSDWRIHEQGLVACGVQVEFVCGKAAAAGRQGR